MYRLLHLSVIIAFTRRSRSVSVNYFTIFDMKFLQNCDYFGEMLSRGFRLSQLKCWSLAVEPKSFCSKRPVDLTICCQKWIFLKYLKIKSQQTSQFGYASCEPDEPSQWFSSETLANSWIFQKRWLWSIEKVVHADRQIGHLAQEHLSRYALISSSDEFHL